MMSTTWNELMQDDVIERLDRIERLLTQRHAGTTPPELSSREAARYLGVGVKTLKQYRRAGLVRYRNASTLGSGKPRYRYPVEDLNRLLRDSYLRDLPAPTPTRPSRHRQTRTQSYEHLDLD